MYIKGFHRDGKFYLKVTPEKDYCITDGCCVWQPNESVLLSDIDLYSDWWELEPEEREDGTSE